MVLFLLRRLIFFSNASVNTYASRHHCRRGAWPEI